MVNRNELQDLMKEIEELEKQANSDTDQLIDKDLIPIFHKLSSLLNPKDIDLALSILQGGTDILKLKIEAIKQYILLLSQKELIDAFLENDSDDILLNSLLTRFWISPFQISSISSKYLIKSYKNLVLEKKSRSVYSPPSELVLTSEKCVEMFSLESKEIQEEILSFYKNILDVLPCELSVILHNYQNPSKYFRYFSYILHLTQEGFLKYDQQTKFFSIAADKEEWAEKYEKKMEKKENVESNKKKKRNLNKIINHDENPNE
ncbi:hypothetical protein [Candidatus Harpocratesius sp.]